MLPLRNSELRFISDNKDLLGKHYLAELTDCPVETIERLETIESAFIGSLKRNGATVLGHTSHQFEPVGATVVVLLAESHASLHTWPENQTVCIDLFTCGDSLDAETALEEIIAHLGAGRQNIKIVERKIPE